MLRCYSGIGCTLTLSPRSPTVASSADPAHQQCGCLSRAVMQASSSFFAYSFVLLGQRKQPQNCERNCAIRSLWSREQLATPSRSYLGTLVHSLGLAPWQCLAQGIYWSYLRCVFVFLVFRARLRVILPDGSQLQLCTILMHCCCLWYNGWIT
jgi:hypothetical protein